MKPRSFRERPLFAEIPVDCPFTGRSLPTSREVAPLPAAFRLVREPQSWTRSGCRLRLTVRMPLQSIAAITIELEAK